VTQEDWVAMTVTVQLAALTSAILLAACLPLAWRLSRSQSRWRPVIEAVLALPLVLPPTVLGFYLLVLLNPDAFLGGLWFTLTGDALTFTFSGLVIASVIYSLPFMMQPLLGAFDTIEEETLEAAASLGCGARERFFAVVLPTSQRAIVAASLLTFAHTIGEFGVVLMMGGNIPGETRVISVVMFEQVETLQYSGAHQLAAALLLFSFLLLLLVYGVYRPSRRRAV
jgi:molybdate transport system permease protein